VLYHAKNEQYKLKMAARIRSLAPMQQLGLEKEKHESNKWIA